jgi:hypothetical protein
LAQDEDFYLLKGEIPRMIPTLGRRKRRLEYLVIIERRVEVVKDLQLPLSMAVKRGVLLY